MWLWIVLGTAVVVVLCLALMHPAVAVDAEHPPKEIARHLEWCLQAKSIAAKTSRLERFWAHWRPSDQAAKNAAAGRSLRQAAYRLLALYLEAGRADKCRELLQWLEESDRGLPGKE